MKTILPLRFHLATLVLVAALPLVGLVVFNTYQQARIESQQATDEALRSARAVAEQSEQRLHRVQSLLSWLAQQPDLSALDPAQCGPVFASFRGLFPEYTNLITVRRDRTRVCSAVPPSPTTPALVDPTLYLSATLEGNRFTLGKVTRGVLTGRWILLAALPLPAVGAQSGAPGVVAVTIDLAGMRLMNDVNALPEGAIAQLIDNRGLILASSSDPEKLIGSTLPDASPWRATKLTPGQIFTGLLHDKGGAGHLYAAAPIAGTDWHAVVGVPVDAIMAPVRERALVNTSAVLLALAAAIALALWTARRTARPVEALAAIARQAAQLPSLPADELPRPDLSSAPRELRALGEDIRTMLAARDAAQQAQRASDERYRQIVETSQEGIWQVDAQARTVFVNARLAQMLGYTIEEMMGTPVLTFLDEESRAQAAVWLQRRRQGQAEHYDFKCQRKDGSELWAFISSTPLTDSTGQFTGSLAMVTDITDRKAIEQELQLHRNNLEALVDVRTQELAHANQALVQARDAANAANRAKSAFLANMSHEIRTPMNAIIGLTHLMSRDTRDTLQRERLNKVDNAAKHLLQVINDILDLSKIEAGKMALEDTEFSLDELLARVFEMVSDRAQEKKLELVLDTDHLPDRLRGDPTRLSQALINLLSNAIKFTEHGWIRLRGELIGEEPKRLQVRFEVQDTGEGISAERQTELFNAFEQADSSATRRHGGTGLGLALTRHLAEMMGGEAGVVSAPNEGSTFWFTAWLARASEAGALAAPIPLQGLRALLVDDLPEALQVISERLQLLGLQVDALPSGSAAVERARSQMASGQPYDVLLIDWRMEPMDGVATLQQLRKMLGAGIPPSILVTAFNDLTMWKQARGAHYDAVLVKPITASALHDTLVRVLRKQSATQPAAPPVQGKAAEQMQSGHAGQRVLLVEDNPVNQEVGEELLRLVGLVVETADNGARAVELALSRPYDLVLMDVQMPVMDGMTATRTIRARAGHGMPIIAMTANAFGEDRAECLAAGMNDHVPKPVDPEMLYRTLLRWMPLRKRPSSLGAASPQPEPSAPALVTKPLQERLSAVEGFNIAQALGNVGGQVSTLDRVLASFIKTYGSGIPALLQADAQDALDQWRTACHSLRGASATIGAAQLLQQLAAFERELFTSNDVPALAQQARQLNNTLLELVSRLRTELETPRD